MTSFIDGPAQGQRLMLKRAVRFMRVVKTGGGTNGIWDALDQPSDTPQPGEKLFAYEITGQPGHCHINRGGGRGGFYPIAEYRFIAEQPTDTEMRSTESWQAWCKRKASSPTAK